MVRDRGGRGRWICAAFYAVYRAGRAGRAGVRSGDDGGAVALRLRAGSPVVAGDRARLRGGRRVSRPGGAPASRITRRSRGSVSATRTALAGLFGEVLALCADAGLVGVEVIAVDGTKVHANASERATCDYEQTRARGPRRRRRDRRRGGRALRRLSAATSCPSSSARARAARVAARRQAPPGTPPRAGGATDSGVASGATARGQAPPGRRAPRRDAAPTPPTRPTGRAADRQDRPAVRSSPPKPYSLPATPAGQDQHHRPRLAQRQDARAAGCRATTPKPSPPSGRSSSPPR